MEPLSGHDAWSLTERPGSLRLKTSRIAGNIYEAVNTLTQRMEGPECYGTVKMDLSKMKDGDVAGLAAFNGHSALLSIKKLDERNILSNIMKLSISVIRLHLMYKLKMRKRNE